MSDVTQNFLVVQCNDKRRELHRFLMSSFNVDANKRILIFTETKKTTDFLACYMSSMNISSTSIHGNRLQRERKIAIEDFVQGKHKVLFATSVALHRRDIENVTDVVNYDLPRSIDDYDYRIGRFGYRGSAMSFLDPERDYKLIPKLFDIFQRRRQEILDFHSNGAYAEEPQEVADGEW